MKNGDWSNMGLSLSDSELRDWGTSGGSGPVAAGGVGRIGGVEEGERRGDADLQLQKQREARVRLAEVLANKRLGVEEVETLIRFLPRDFMLAYLQVVDLAVGEKSLGSGRGYDQNDLGLGKRSGVQVKSEKMDHRGSAAKGKMTGGGAIPIRSESAMEARRKTDRGLRQISRTLKAFLSGSTSEVVQRRCSGKCKRFGDPEFLYCPNCAAPMIDIVPVEKKRK